MPLIDLSVKHNWVFNKTWCYNKPSKIKENESKKIIIANDSLMKEGKKIIFLST